MKTRPQKKRLFNYKLEIQINLPKHSATPGHILIVSKIKCLRETLRRLTNFSFYKICKHLGYNWSIPIPHSHLQMYVLRYVSQM